MNGTAERKSSAIAHHKIEANKKQQTINANKSNDSAKSERTGKEKNGNRKEEEMVAFVRQSATLLPRSVSLLGIAHLAIGGHCNYPS